MLAKNGPWKAEVERMLLAQGAEQKDLIAKQTQMVTGLQDLYDKADTSIREINTKLLHNPGLQGGGREKKWELSRPKHLEPSLFNGKEEDWPKWKEEVQDYAEAVC